MGLNTAWRFPVDLALRRWVFPGLLLSLSISLIRSVASRILFGDWECLLWVVSRLMHRSRPDVCYRGETGRFYGSILLLATVCNRPEADICGTAILMPSPP